MIYVTYLPLIFILGYIPLLTRGMIYERLVLSSAIWFPEGSLYDFFLVIKSYGIILAGIFALIIFIFDPEKRLKKDPIFIPFLGYFTFAIISGITSEYTELSLFGSFEVMESLPVILVYGFLFFYGWHYIRRDGGKGLKILAFGSLPGVVAVLLIGLFQGFHINFLQTNLARTFILDPEMAGIVKEFTTDEVNPLYSTLYNSDNATIYFALVFFTALVLYLSMKPSRYKFIILGVAALAFADIIMAKTATGVVLLISGSVLLFIIWAIKKRIGYKILLGACGGVIGVCVLIATLTPYGAKFMTEAGFVDDFQYKILSIETGSFGSRFELPDRSITIACGESKEGDPVFFCRTNKGERVFNKNIGGGKPYYYLEDIEGVRQIKIENIEQSHNEVKYTVSFDFNDGLTPWGWDFAYDRGSSACFFINPAGKRENFPDAPERILAFPDTFLTARGMIWNYTLPKLGSFIAFGKGANTYVMVYPQEDYLTEMRLEHHSLDVKPHSFYLQQWVENGLIALVFIMVFFILYLIRMWKICIPDHYFMESHYYALEGILMVSVFLIAGITQDSNICSSPLFWALSGIALGGAQYVKTEE